MVSSRCGNAVGSPSWNGSMHADRPLNGPWLHSGPPSLGPDSGPRYSPGPRLGVKTGIPSLGIANPEPRDAYLGPEARGSAV